MPDDNRRAEPGAGEETREREDAARARRAAAEGREAEREREAELSRDEPGVLPPDADEERTGVMPPPRGTGAG